MLLVLLDSGRHRTLAEEVRTLRRSSACVISGLYALICRTPDEGGTGGLTPEDVTLHAPGFYRYDRDDLGFLTGASIDRRVQIIPSGMRRLLPIRGANTVTYMKVFNLTIRVGYFAGSHAPDTYSVMADDDVLITKTLSKQANWPNCAGVTNIRPLSSNLVRLDPSRFVWEITVEVQVMG